ncbi:hypothetical protein A2765_03535 [Candidatus Kaiserbacteria bacterium RIFCSPHIGHO2_01_FULL_56_24]|uniref:Uncharacterized protein n=1 Tax=Candidatus Kaiserbacteria bacterium RIFCSPHIGHO2_01_FULL_56_24 TaxID=1798487 RepID=A0A1F6DGS3_9BACT|nr:MAG: hypothetical protein A2765_03535 [Candidatus Kaiserbacteria bacterium RIFCSPHIGHO2_01_FULL_56_24]
MEALKGGDEFVGQIIRKFNETTLHIWALDHKVAFPAYGVDASAWRIDELVVCRLDATASVIRKIERADASIETQYARKKFHG